MSLILEFSIAIKYLQAKKKEAFISVNAVFALLGIAIGVAALIVVMAIMNGFRTELTSKIIGLNSDIMISGVNGKSFGGYNKIIDQLATIPEIKKSYPVIIGQALATHNNESQGILIKALTLNDLQEQKMISENIARGNLDSFNTPSTVIIGEALSRRLGVQIGDTVSLVSPQFNMTIIGQIPRIKEFTVTATFNSGLNDFDQNYIIMSLTEGQRFLDIAEGRVNQIEVFTTNPYDSPKTSFEIIQLLKSDHLYVSDWQQINVHIFNALKTEKVAMFVILTLIIVVASFNIISSLVMLVTDKTKEIAILRTLGMTKLSITRIFLFCGMLIGFSGTALGVTLGLLVAYNINSIKEFLSQVTGTNIFDPVIYYLDSLPSNVDENDVVYIIIMSLLLSLFSTIYPAYKASRMSPVKGLKHE